VPPADHAVAAAVSAPAPGL